MTQKTQYCCSLRLAVAEAKSAPSSGSFASESKSVATRCVRTSELEAHHSITFKHVAETATMMPSFGAFSVANTHPIREKRF